jgi:hypothetical protein
MPDNALATQDAMLMGILALLADEREARVAGQAGVVKTELLLSDAGLSNATIARVLGKQQDAVRMAVTRGKSQRAIRESSPEKQDGE